MANYLDQSMQYGALENLRDAFDHDPSIEYALTPLWREVIWPTEWFRLRVDPVFYGINTPRGNGEPVLLVPGFMAGDFLMLEMHRWLKRIGYDAHLSGIFWNTDCPDATAKHLLKKVKDIQQKTGQKVRLVGHSLGGMLAKCLVQQEPDLIDRVITMGSPFQSLVKAHPAVVGIWEKIKLNQSATVGRNLKPSCATGFCTCGFVKSILQPVTVLPPQFAIYSKLDGVADWESCIENDASMNTEVSCTHIGMIVNHTVYRAVANRLAQEIDDNRS
ncbi:MAG: triacylglycerol lipase [Pseudohongiellaceae bacterium]